MSYCPRCGEDGLAYMLDCGCQVCEDCVEYRELMSSCCETCRAEVRKERNAWRTNARSADKSATATGT